jgi:hypothetical protein
MPPATTHRVKYQTAHKFRHFNRALPNLIRTQGVSVKYGQYPRVAHKKRPQHWSGLGSLPTAQGNCGHRAARPKRGPLQLVPEYAVAKSSSAKMAGATDGSAIHWFPPYLARAPVEFASCVVRPRSGWSRDVSEDIAEEILQRLNAQAEYHSAHLEEFLDRHAPGKPVQLPLPLRGAA